jgi:hypothetical protein
MWKNIALATLFLALMAGQVQGLQAAPVGWVKLPGTMTHLDVGNSNHFWAVNSSGYAFQWNGSSFTRKSTSPALKYIAAGNDGTVGAVGTNGVVYLWNGSSWATGYGSGAYVSVGKSSLILGVDSAGKVYQWTSSGWALRSSSPAMKFVSIASDGTAYGVTSANAIYKWGGSSWSVLSGSLKYISAGGSTLVVGLDANGYARRLSGSSWSSMNSPVLAYISAGSDGRVVGVTSGGAIYLYDNVKPMVRITSPKNDATVSSGKLTVSADAEDNVAVAKVEFYVNGVLKGTDTSSPYSYVWDNSSYPNGSHTLRVVAYDTAKNSQSHQISIRKASLPPPKYLTSGRATDAMSVFIKSVELFDSGNSGIPYFVVVNIDPAKVPQYTAKERDPYWLKYLTSMVQNGQFASAYAPSKSPDWVNFFNSQSNYISNPKATYSNGSWKFYNGYQDILNYKWAANGYYNAHTGIHYRKNIPVNSGLSFVPSATMVYNNKVTGIYEPYPASTHGVYTVYMNMRIVHGSRSIVAGEVTADGWGLIPMSATHAQVNGFNIPYSPWVIVKPFNVEISRTPQAGKAWFDVAGGGSIKPLQYGGVTAKTTDAAYQAMMQNALSLNAAGFPDYAFNADLNQASFAFVGYSQADKFYAGASFLTYGKTVSGELEIYGTQLTAAERDAAVLTHRTVIVNGSLNSLADAFRNAATLSAGQRSKPVVMVYMPQSLNYAGADNSAVKATLADINFLSLANNIPISVTAHSFSVHFTLSTFMNNPFATLNLIAGAHGNFPVGGKLEFYDNLRYSHAPVNLFVGTRDPIGFLGGGTDSSAIFNTQNNIHGMGSVYQLPAFHSIGSFVDSGLHNVYTLPPQ